MTMLEGVAQSADRWSEEIIALRRKIHESPELAFEEHETAARVEEFLTRLDIPCRTGIAKTGIVALLQGGKPGPTIAIRADMDALPIDFAWSAERVPSGHLRIGSQIDGLNTAIHRADYQLNEQVIPLGMKVMTRAVLSLMG